MRKVIDNGIVEMDWDADLYFETDEGFYAAVNVYEGEDGMDVPVIFQIFGDAVVAFLLLDDDTHQPADIEDIVSVIKDSYTEDFAISEVLDGYVELGENEVATPENLINFGLSDSDIQDVTDRIYDLNNYFESEDIEM